MWSRFPRRTSQFGFSVDTPFAALTQHFESNDWAYETDDAQKIVHATLNGQSGEIRMIAGITDDDDLLEAVAILPVKIPANARQQAAEFCIRASYRMKSGHFELDFDDGRVRFHASAPFADAHLHDSVIHRCVGAAALLSDYYFPHLMSVIYGVATPASAVKNADAQLGQDSRDA